MRRTPIRRPRGAARGEAALRRSHRRAAMISLALVIVVTVAVFVKHDPFAAPFELRAKFSSAAQLSVGGDVRTAGVRVGQVSAIDHGPHGTALITMTISSSGLPLHADATLTVRPRLVLEGNAYVDLSPGTPTAPELRSGQTLPVTQTAVPVQIDQALDTLTSPTRQALAGSVASLAAGLGGSRTPGSAGLRTGVRALARALGSITAVSRAAQGTRPGDLGGVIGGLSGVATELAARPAELADFVTSYDHVVGALASQDQALSASVQQLDALLRAAPAPLAAVDSALPRLTRFAATVRPALRVAPGSFTQTNRLLDRIASLVRPTVLPALLDTLAPVLNGLPSVEQSLRTLFTYTAPVTSCISTHVVPVLDSKLADGVNSTGDPVYLDMLHLFTGLTSLASSVDGNGGTLRIGVTTADHAIDTFIPALGQVVGRLPNVDGVRPAWLGYGVDPPFRPDQPCAGQPLPRLDVPAAPAPDLP